MKLIGVKKEMTQIFDDKGIVRGATVVKLEAGLPIGSPASNNELVVGDRVAVSGISKGKGFQGVVKRHGFHGGPRSHGQKHSEREPGAIGGGGGRAGGRVAKGIRMAGRMGGDRVTVGNLMVLAVDETKKEVIVSGAIPGRRGTKIELRKL
ncbi:MAG: 50S ribosomal protein L3 [Candidatus Vogelbacteria bacterium]